MSKIKILEESLANLGLSDIERVVWLTNRDLGTVPASYIAKDIGKGRVTVYKVLERLEEYELVVRIEQDRVAHFSTIPLTELRQMVLKKSQDMIGQAVAMHDLIAGDEMDKS